MPGLFGGLFNSTSETRNEAFEVPQTGQTAADRNATASNTNITVKADGKKSQAETTINLLDQGAIQRATDLAGDAIFATRDNSNRAIGGLVEGFSNSLSQLSAAGDKSLLTLARLAEKTSQNDSTALVQDATKTIRNIGYSVVAGVVVTMAVRALTGGKK